MNLTSAIAVLLLSVSPHPRPRHPHRNPLSPHPHHCASTMRFDSQFLAFVATAIAIGSIASAVPIAVPAGDHTIKDWISAGGDKVSCMNDNYDPTAVGGSWDPALINNPCVKILETNQHNQRRNLGGAGFNANAGLDAILNMILGDGGLMAKATGTAVANAKAGPIGPILKKPCPDDKDKGEPEKTPPTGTAPHPKPHPHPVADKPKPHPGMDKPKPEPKPEGKPKPMPTPKPEHSDDEGNKDPPSVGGGIFGPIFGAHGAAGGAGGIDAGIGGINAGGKAGGEGNLHLGWPFIEIGEGGHSLERRTQGGGEVIISPLFPVLSAHGAAGVAGGLDAGLTGIDAAGKAAAGGYMHLGWPFVEVFDGNWNPLQRRDAHPAPKMSKATAAKMDKIRTELRAVAAAELKKHHGDVAAAKKEIEELWNMVMQEYAADRHNEDTSANKPPTARKLADEDQNLKSIRGIAMQIAALVPVQMKEFQLQADAIVKKIREELSSGVSAPPTLERRVKESEMSKEDRDRQGLTNQAIAMIPAIAKQAELQYEAVKSHIDDWGSMTFGRRDSAPQLPSFDDLAKQAADAAAKTQDLASKVDWDDTEKAVASGVKAFLASSPDLAKAIAGSFTGINVPDYIAFASKLASDPNTAAALASFVKAFPSYEKAFADGLAAVGKGLPDITKSFPGGAGFGPATPPALAEYHAVAAHAAKRLRAHKH